jgi:hypothetical protein
LRLIIPFCLYLLSSIFSINSFSQYIPIHPQKNNIYSFLDELPVNYNQSIKPLSLLEISGLLTSTDTSKLTSRQKKELTFYLKDFSKETHQNKNFPRRTNLFFYRDSRFSLTVNPIAGGTAWVNQNGSEYHWWNSAEAIASIGNWGFFASLRDNHLSSQLYSPEYLDQQPAGSSFKEGFEHFKSTL